MPKSQIDALLQKSKNKSPTKHTLKHTFQWPVPLELTKDDLKQLKLIKGVAMQEGEVKSGEAMKRDNVIAGAGALRASSLLGFAFLDIDHFAEDLPKEYTDEYPGLDVPCGFHLDAQAVENTVGTEQKKLMEVEFIAALENDKAYEMVKNHDFVGCSVVDYARSLNCEKCNSDGTDDADIEAQKHCSCNYDGSAYLQNTLVLKEVPNSNGTWVDIVTEEDIGTIIQNTKGKDYTKLSEQFNTKPTPLQTKILNCLGKQHHTKTNHEYHEADLTNYMNDGIWINGKDSIVSFLTEEKGLEESLAAEMAQYLFENPTKLNQYQLTDLSADDMVAWWNTFVTLEKQLNSIKHRVATLSWLEHNAKPLRALSHAYPLGYGEVQYGDAAAGSQCQDCRWYSSSNFDESPEEKGYCQLLSGDVDGIKGCDRFEMIPGSGGSGSTPPTEEEDPTETEDPEPQMDGEDEVAPDEDGNCPTGYTLSEDGTMCIKDDQATSESSGDGGEQSAAVPNDKSKRHTFIPGKRNPEIKKNALVEKHPSQKSNTTDQKLQDEINKLKQTQKRLALELKHASKFAKNTNEKSLKLQKVTAEIKRLTALKKKS